MEDEQHNEQLTFVLAKVVGGFLEENEAIWVEYDDFQYMVYYNDGELHIVSADDEEDFQDLTKFKLVEFH